MRIVILADPLDEQRSGIHTYTAGLINGLLAHDDKPEVMLIRKKVDKLLKCKQYRVGNVWPFKNFDPIRKFLIIPRLMARLEPDVVIEPAHFGPWNLPKSIKRVTMIHDLTPIKFPQWHKSMSSLLQKWFLPRILQRSNLILTNSQHSAKDIESYIPELSNKLVPIHLGIDSSFKRMEDPNILDKYDIECPYFLFVSTIEPRKNLETLLKAFEEIAGLTTGCQLVIVGQIGWKADHIVKAIKSHPFSQRIVRLGYIPREALPVLYTHALALVYPSQYEGFGLPIAEAMACGCPVLVARNSSLTEVGGELAQYFDTFDVQGLVALMKSKLERAQPEAEEQESLIQHAQQFDWTLYGRHLMKHLEGLVAE